jgi:hypothetical protein
VSASSLPIGPDKPKFFRCQSSIDRALSFRYGLGLGGGLAGHYFAADRKTPFPELPADALHNRVIDVPISQRQSSSFFDFKPFLRRAAADRMICLSARCVQPKCEGDLIAASARAKAAP